MTIPISIAVVRRGGPFYCSQRLEVGCERRGIRCRRGWEIARYAIRRVARWLGALSALGVP